MQMKTLTKYNLCAIFKKKYFGIKAFKYTI